MSTQRVLEILTASYPNTEITSDTIRIYDRLLSDIPEGVLEAACVQHIAQSRFFPTVAEMRELSSKLMDKANGSEHISSMEAWGIVQRKISHTGVYNQLDLMIHLLRERLSALAGVTCATRHLIPWGVG